MSFGTDSLSSYEFCLKKLSFWYHFIGFLSVFSAESCCFFEFGNYSDLFWGKLQQLNILNCLMILRFTPPM